MTMNDKVNLIDNDIPAYKKKSKKTGLPRSKHKHIYETVLLCRNWHSNNVHNGAPEVHQFKTPTKVCVICGRVDCLDDDPSYYVKQEVGHLPFILSVNKLSEKALSLPKWYLEDYFDKFAIKMEEDDE